jgi:transglutaminase-like putative cysteine protease
MMMGEGFSHAWVEVSIGGVWMGFDPTNDKIVDDTYIKISRGRDYQDCIVNRGVFYGCVTQTQNIKVVVSEV